MNLPRQPHYYRLFVLVFCAKICTLSAEESTMITPMTITEAGKKITSLEHTMDYDDTIAITNHGREVFALIKWDTYESIRETLEILSDKELSEQLAVGIRQINQNKLVDFDSFKQKLLCTR